MIAEASKGFLAGGDLERLTGYAPGEKKRQRAWLEQHGYVYGVNARGEVLVLWEHVREMLCLKEKGAPEPEGPDLTAAFEPLRQRKTRASSAS